MGVEIEKEIVCAICQVVQKEGFRCTPRLCVCVFTCVFVCVFCHKMNHLGCLLNHLHYCLRSRLLSLKELQEMWRAYCLQPAFGHLCLCLTCEQHTPPPPPPPHDSAATLNL